MGRKAKLPASDISNINPANLPPIADRERDPEYPTKLSPPNNTEQNEQKSVITIFNEERIGIINDQKEYTYYYVDDIVYLHSDDSSTTIYFSTNSPVEKVICPSTGIGKFEDGLPKRKFYRLHNEYIVNLRYIKNFFNNDEPYVLLTEGDKQINVARRRKTALLKHLSAMDVTGVTVYR